MKAFIVSDRNGDTGFSYVVFAEKRSKAIYYALNYSDGAFDWCTWTEMRATRAPALDGFYHGNAEMDWGNMAERVAMVRYAGFYCSDEFDVASDECERCAAHEWCIRYDRMTR